MLSSPSPLPEQDWEARYRALARATPEMVWTYAADGSDGDMIEWLRYTGQSLEEASGWGWTQAIHPEDLPRIQAQWSEATRLKKLYQSEFRLRSAAGEYRTFMVRGAPVLDENGTLVEWVGTCTDLEDAGAPELALQASNDSFTSAFEYAAIGMALVDLTGKWLRVNQSLCDFLGYTAAEMKQLSFQEITHPDDLGNDLTNLERLLKGELRFYHMEKRYFHRDGHILWIQLGVSLVRDPEGQPLYFVAQIQDMTQHKVAEQELRSAQQELEMRVLKRTQELAVSNLQLQVGKNHLIEGNQTLMDLARLRANSKVELTAMWQNFTEAGSTLLNTQRCSIWLYNADKNQIHCVDLFDASKTSHTSGGMLSVQDYPAYFAEVSRRKLIVAHQARTHPATAEFKAGYLEPLGIFAMLDAPLIVGGEMVGVVCCEHVGEERTWELEDQTFVRSLAFLCALAVESAERAEAEAALLRAKEEAEDAYKTADAANLAKSQFLSRMSHELRTPLNAILGFGQIMEMRRDELESDMADNLAQILKAGRHLLNLINEVLDITKLDSGGMEIHLMPVNVYQILTETLDLVRPLAQSRNIRLTSLNAPSGMHETACYVSTDAQRLKQILLNLLSNGIKYNRPGGELTVTCTNSMLGKVRIEVRDQGKGIAAEHLERIFQPFERLGAANTSTEGTGMGLFIAQQLSKAIGAELTVTSVVGEGCAFTLELPQASGQAPLLARPLAEGMSKSPQLDEPVPALPMEKRFCVLCVEDNASNLRLIEAILRARPAIALLPAIQGTVGLMLARQHHPDLILLDLNLPDMTGLEVLTALKQYQETAHIPVIIVSADATPAQVELLKQAGAVEYITKPIDIKHFQGLVDFWLTADTSGQKG